MNKADKIREALIAVAPGGLTYAQLTDKTGIDRKQVGPNVASFTQRGEVLVKADKDGLNRYHLNPDYRSGNKPSDPRRGRKPAAMPRVHKPKAGNGADLAALALDNYIAAGALLRQAIEDGVDDLAGALGIKAALANHDRAEKLLAAAKV